MEGRIRSGKLSRRDIVRRLGELAFGSANDCVRLVLEDCPDLDALELSLLSEVRRSDKGGVEVKLIDRLKAVEALSAAIGADGCSPGGCQARRIATRRPSSATGRYGRERPWPWDWGSSCGP